MEVYRYWTSGKLAEARSAGKIESNYPRTFPRFPRHIFVLPENPLAWGTENMRKLVWNVNLNHRRRSDDQLVLLRFNIAEDDPAVFIRDLYDWDWQPIATHKPAMFQFPEIIVPTPIPIEFVTQIQVPIELDRNPSISLW